MIAAEYLDETDGQWKPCHEVRRWRNGVTVGSNCIGKEGRFQIEAHKVRRLEPKEKDRDLILYAIELWVRRYSRDVADNDWPKTALSSVEENSDTFECRVILRNEKGILATYKQNARGMRIEKPNNSGAKTMSTKTITTYGQACEAYLKWAKARPGEPELPSEIESEEYDGIWHLDNVQGPLAAVTSTGEVVPAGDFLAAYERLAIEGKCDAAGGMEYQRVLREWIESKPDDLDEFIVCRANLGPHGLPLWCR